MFHVHFGFEYILVRFLAAFRGLGTDAFNIVNSPN